MLLGAAGVGRGCLPESGARDTGQCVQEGTGGHVEAEGLSPSSDTTTTWDLRDAEPWVHSELGPELSRFS